MAKKGFVKKVFPGGNTPQGFYSFYDNIVTHDATRLIIIKGGPGVGKSTFMMKIAESMVERGYDVELHHCSSDNGSIDGVVIPSIGVALIDGTAPHRVVSIQETADKPSSSGFQIRFAAVLHQMDIPYCNHEKWDGTGYPRGLKSEQIPLGARIFAVGRVGRLEIGPFVPAGLAAGKDTCLPEGRGGQTLRPAGG